MNDKLNLPAPVLILFTVTVAFYCTAFNGDFHYDDSLTILENPHVDRFDTFIGHLDHMVRPVLYATFLIDRSLFGLNPVGYHLLNLMLHLGSGLLLYRILTNAVPDKAASIPFWAALLFLNHPIATEAVTYISGRASGLMAFFYLLAFFLYLRASEQRDAGTDRRLISVAVVSFLLSLGSKETAMTFPFVLLLWDVFIRQLRGASLRTAILSRHLPFWIVLILTAGWAWGHPRYFALAQFSLDIRPFWENALSELHAMTYGASLLVCPWKQNFDHDLPVFQSITQWPLPLDLLAWGALIVAAIRWRRDPLITFGLAWYVLQWIPMILIPRVDLLSERNLYLPSIGLLLALVVLGAFIIEWLAPIFQRHRLIRFVSAGLAAALVAVLCLFTYQRNLLYQDRLLLWSDAVRKSPNKARPHNNLGYAYSLHGDWDRAIEEFRTAAQLDLDYVLAQENLRDAYLHRVGRQ